MANLLSTIDVTAISRLRVTASWHGSTPRGESASAVYNPPPGYVILETFVDVHSENNGSRAVSVIAGGLNLATEETITTAFSHAFAFAGKNGNSSLSANLSNKMNDIRSEIRSWSSNMNTVLAIVRAHTHGTALIDQKRGWEEISVRARLKYLGAPTVHDIIIAIEEEFGIDIPNI